MCIARTWGFDADHTSESRMSAAHDTHYRAVENLIYEWARAIDEDRVEDIATLLSDDGQYKVASRFNVDRGLPLAVIDCKSPAQLRDRIKSMRVANIYEPHHYRHIVSGVQILGEWDGCLEVRSNYAVIRTMDHDGSTMIFSSGQCRDLVVLTDAAPRFRQRHVIYDSRAIETLLVIPL
jgi:anthranilate 1,2-dioxygenase small subunit